MMMAGDVYEAITDEPYGCHEDGDVSVIQEGTKDAESAPDITAIIEALQSEPYTEDALEVQYHPQYDIQLVIKHNGWSVIEVWNTGEIQKMERDEQYRHIGTTTIGTIPGIQHHGAVLARIMGTNVGDPIAAEDRALFGGDGATSSREGAMLPTEDDLLGTCQALGVSLSAEVALLLYEEDGTAEKEEEDTDLHVTIDEQFDAALDPERWNVLVGDTLAPEDGRLPLQKRVGLITDYDFTPTAERPVTVTTDVIFGTNTDGVVIGTRTSSIMDNTGISAKNRISAGIEHGVAFIYQSIDGKGELLAETNDLPALEPGIPYSVTVTDDGSTVSLLVSLKGEEIVSLHGESDHRFTHNQVSVQNLTNEDRGISIEHLQISQPDEALPAPSAYEKDGALYTRMHVKPDTHRPDVFRVHYFTPEDSLLFVVTIEGEPEPILEEVVTHDGGTVHSVLELDMDVLARKLGDGRVEIAIWDAEREKQLDWFEGSYDRSTRTVSGETDGNWDDVEMGMLAENPIEPSLQIVKIEGPTILVALQTPYDTGHIHLEGGGFLNSVTMEYEGGTDLTGQILTFNVDNPEGYYRLDLFEGRHNRLIAGADFHWNPDTETLTLRSDGEVTMMHEGGTEYFADIQEQFDSMMSLETATITDPTLRLVQQSKVEERSVHRINYEDAQESIAGSRVSDMQDASLIFYEGAGAYNTVLGELLNLAVDLTVHVWHGRSQAEAQEEFEREYGEKTAGFRLKHFVVDFGVRFPTWEELWEEGMAMAPTITDILHDNQDQQDTVYGRLSRVAEQEESKDEGSENTANGIVKSAQAVIIVTAETLSFGNELHDVLGDVAFSGMGEVGSDNVENVVSAAPLEFGSALNEALDDFELSESSETVTSDNTLIILMYGSNQFVGEPVGFENLALQLHEYPHVLSVSPGHNPFAEDPHLDPDNAFAEIQHEIERMIEQNPLIENIVLAGYSWGGGMVYDIAEWLQSHPDFKSKDIVAAAYVDAVTLNSFTAENRIPPGVEHMINIYQSNPSVLADGPLMLNGGSIHRAEHLTTFQEIDMDEFGDFHTHTSIDEAAVPFLEGFIKSIIQRT